MADALLRERIRLVTAVLTVVSLALVFAAAGQRVPTDLLPRAPDVLLDAIPHVNAAISALAIVTIAAGWRDARRERFDRHRTRMLGGLLLFATFLALYLYRVALLGPHEFPGPDGVYQLVYLPTLAVHVLLAVVCIPLLYYVALLGLTRSIPEIRSTIHARVGRVAAALWLVSFALGIVVYLFLYRVY